MEIGERIRQRREELSMSQDELAKRVGYKSRSSVNKIEADGRGLPQRKIVAFAKALETTPSYLMGWEPVTDEDIGNIFSNANLFETIENISSLSPSEKNHFIKYLRLFEINRKKADNYIDQLLSLQNMETDLEVQAAHERTDIEVTDEMRKHDDDLMDGEW